MKLSINGPDSLVENGDPYSPLNVLSDPPFGGSSMMANQFRAQANPAFNGYDYRVTVTSNALTDYTYIQVYDAATCSTSFNDLTSGAGFGVPSPPFVYNGNTNFATFYSLYKYNSATIMVDPFVKTRGRGTLRWRPLLSPAGWRGCVDCRWRDGSQPGRRRPRPVSGSRAPGGGGGGCRSRDSGSAPGGPPSDWPSRSDRPPHT